MPKTTKRGTPKQEELPGTLQRSNDKAQETYAKAHDSAVESYGEGRRAHQTAFAALKHTHEKVGTTGSPRTARTGDLRTPEPPAGVTPIARPRAGSMPTPRSGTCGRSLGASTSAGVRR